MFFANSLSLSQGLISILGESPIAIYQEVLRQQIVERRYSDPAWWVHSFTPMNCGLVHQSESDSVVFPEACELCGFPHGLQILCSSNSRRAENFSAFYFKYKDFNLMKKISSKVQMKISQFARVSMCLLWYDTWQTHLCSHSFPLPPSPKNHWRCSLLLPFLPLALLMLMPLMKPSGHTAWQHDEQEGWSGSSIRDRKETTDFKIMGKCKARGFVEKSIHEDIVGASDGAPRWRQGDRDVLCDWCMRFLYGSKLDFVLGSSYCTGNIQWVSRLTQNLDCRYDANLTELFSADKI